MRCFLGLDLSIQNKLTLEQWRDKALPSMDKAVPAGNFHITLSFLGSIEQNNLDRICAEMDEQEIQKISLRLDQMGYWSKPKVLFVAPSSIPMSLQDLAKRTDKLAKQCHIPVKHSQYRPHVTIARGLKDNPPCELYPPNIECEFDHVHLFESVSGRSGVRYPIRKSWKCKPRFSF